MKKFFAVAAAAVAALALTAGVAMADQFSDQDKGFEIGGSTQNEGGLFRSTDGRFDYHVPGDAYWFADRVKIKFTYPGESNLPPRPDNSIWVGAPFHFEMREWDTNTQLSYRLPATIILHYKPEELGGRPESSLRIVRLFDNWQVVPATIDTTNHTLTTQAQYGGDWGLVVYNSDPPAMPTPPPSPQEVAAQQAAAAAQQNPTGSTVTGKFFYDKNGNGVFDGDDTPVDTVGVRISSDSFDAITSTGPDGTYSFSSLGAGTYAIFPVVGAQWDFTTPNPVGGITLTGKSDSNGTANFGLTYKSWYTPLQ